MYIIVPRADRAHTKQLVLHSDYRYYRFMMENYNMSENKKTQCLELSQKDTSSRSDTPVYGWNNRIA